MRRRFPSAGKGEFYEIVAGNERCGGFMVVCNWIRVDEIDGDL